MPVALVKRVEAFLKHRDTMITDPDERTDTERAVSAKKLAALFAPIFVEKVRLKRALGASTDECRELSDLVLAVETALDATIGALQGSQTDFREYRSQGGATAVIEPGTLAAIAAAIRAQGE